MSERAWIAEMRKTAATLNRTLATFNQVAEVQSKELQSTLVALRKGISSVDSARVDSIVRSLQQTTATFQNMTGEMQTASARFNSLLTKVDSGNGSMAKLLNDPALYNDFRQIMLRVDSLMIDFQKNPRKYLKFSVF